VPGDLRRLGPQQLGELVLDVLVELVDGGIGRDLQNVLGLAALTVDDRTALAPLEAAAGVGVGEATPRALVAEPARRTELTGAGELAPPLIAGAGTVAIATARVTVATTERTAVATRGALTAARVPIAAEAARTGTVAIAAPRVTVATTERAAVAAGGTLAVTTARITVATGRTLTTARAIAAARIPIAAAEAARAAVAIPRA
jgi:hypothetical protein